MNPEITHTKKPPAWSYSSIKLFETCPRKYQAERVTKEVRFTDNEHTTYGKALHTAAELYIEESKPLSPEFTYINDFLDSLKNIEGTKFTELKLGFKTVDGVKTACDFFDKDVEFRGVADLVILNEAKNLARVVDYKTSKNSNYADLRQLGLMAFCLFLRYPTVHAIKAGLLFVKTGEFIKRDYSRDTMYATLVELSGLLARRSVAYSTNIWNPKPNGLCKKYCQVECPHNGGLK